MKRIGILCVHGIGDQPRFQHVDKVARNLREHLCRYYGTENVFTESPGAPTRSLTPHVSFLIKGQKEAICFDLVEMWWRDLSERAGFKRLIRFWWWALTLWTTERFAETPVKGRSLPAHTKSTVSFATSAIERARFFFYSLSFFVLLLPLQVVLSVLAIIPFVRRIDVFHSVYAYMSSIKLYEQDRNDTIQDILDFSVPRRIRIQRRIINEILSMAQADFNAWYILSHSLGSVISFKALMYDEPGFARSLSLERWSKLGPEWKILNCEGSKDYVDKPVLPPWLQEGEGVALKKVYTKLRGFFTYGSPLETFATLWPSLVEMNTDLHYIRCPWINFYDTRDFISSPINTMDDLQEALPLHNINVNSHWMVIKSHTNYFTRDVGSDLLLYIIETSNNDVVAFKSSASNNGLINFIIAALQVACVFASGALMLPVAIGGVWNAISAAVKSLDALIVAHAVPAYVYAQMNDVSNYFDQLRFRIDDDGIWIAGVIESLILSVLALLLVGMVRIAVVALIAGLNPNSRRRPR